MYAFRCGCLTPLWRAAEPNALSLPARKNPMSYPPTIATHTTFALGEVNRVSTTSCMCNVHYGIPTEAVIGRFRIDRLCCSLAIRLGCPQAHRQSDRLRPTGSFDLSTASSHRLRT